MSNSPRDWALIGLFAALISAFGLLGILPLGPIPVTPQNLGAMLAGTLLGARRGVAAVVCFELLTFAGLPLLAGGRGGIAPLVGPSAGYLIGWIPGTLVIGLLARPSGRSYHLGRALAANIIGGIAVVYAVGIPVSAWWFHSRVVAIAVSTVQFLPGDLAKAVISAFVGRSVSRALPDGCR
ncbi:biotin transporter BioY [Silvibacterium sp.]|uniref:biotin transporter BioY n=1 Tax=Silvibacterium sp. TaxID=1964179 RepID=UPI0039E56640